MDYVIFERNLINYLKKNKTKKCVNIINSNKEIVEENFGKNIQNSGNIKIFIEKFNAIILQRKDYKGNFRIFEKVLELNLFTEVLKEFRESTIFVTACQKKKVELIKWLLKMNINQKVQDKYGRTALMFLCKVPIFSFAVKSILKNNKDCLEITDNLGRTALFYAANNSDATYQLIFAGANLDHKDNNGNTVLNYCCKNEYFYSVLPLIRNKCELNTINNKGKTPINYLTENNDYWELKQFSKRPIDKDSKSSQEAIISLIKQIYQPHQKRHPNFYIPYYKTLKTLIDCQYNFNIVIDDEGNSPLMFFIMIQDFFTVYYMVKNLKNLDLSLKNKNNDDAFSLSLKLNNKNLIKYIVNQKSFDFKYNDQFNNNILIFYIISNDNKMVRKILYKNISLINQVNIKKESPLIIATKLNRITIIKTLLRLGADVNHQDNLGNTALYYAVDLKDLQAISILTYYKSDLYLKNKRNKSPMDMIQHYPDKQKILDVISNASLMSSRSNQGSNNSSRQRLRFSLKSFSSGSLSQKIPKKLKNTKRHQKESDKDSLLQSRENLSVLKYQNTVEFKMSENKNKYEPLPNSDIIRVIEMDIYKCYNETTEQMSVTGVSFELYYRILIFESIQIILTALLIFIV